MEYRENNILIAKFMGFAADCDIYDSPMSYHTKWDWLMPVVEKMWNITDHKSLFYQEVTNEVTLFAPYSTLKESNLNNVYGLVIIFIKWYNKNKL